MSDATQLRVRAVRISGDDIGEEVFPVSMRIGEIKNCFAEACQVPVPQRCFAEACQVPVPPVFLRAMCGATEMQDDETLAAYHERSSEEPMMITLVVSFSPPESWDTELLPCMSSTERIQVMRFLEAALPSELHDDSSLATATRFCLMDSSSSHEERSTAMDIMIRRTAQDMSSVVHQASLMIEDEFDVGVRRDAARVLRLLCEAGAYDLVIESAARRLSHPKWYVRQAAVWALGEALDFNKTRVHTELSALLKKETRAMVLSATREVLAGLSKQSSEDVQVPIPAVHDFDPACPAQLLA